MRSSFKAGVVVLFVFASIWCSTAFAQPGPGRPSDLLESTFTLRPLASLNGAIGVIGGVDLTYHFPIPMYVRLESDSNGFQHGNPYGYAADVIGYAGLDLEYVAVGLGGGIGTLWTTETVQADVGPLAGIDLRLGHIDGVVLRMSASAGYGFGRVIFSHADAKIIVPIDSSIALLMHGSGGFSGYGYAEGGARFRLSPMNAKVPVFAQFALGVGGVGNYSQVGNAGLSMSYAIEFRL
jgi:hypothetical protein